MPLVSVALPVYNGAEHLGEAVDSILAQTFGDFELIIVDDGSTDESPSIIEDRAESDPRIRVIRQSKTGLVGALNRALTVARGDYVARMDADDISLPERLAKQVAFMEAHPRVGVCGTVCRLFGDSRGVSWTSTDPDEIRCRMLFWPCISHPTAMMRRELIVEHDLFYDPAFEEAEDYDLWFRFSHCSELANLPDILLHYRVRGGQKTNLFRSSVREWSGRVHAAILANLGIEPSRREAELHASLHTSEFQRSDGYLEEVESWLLTIIDANDAARVYDPHSLAGVLLERWTRACVFQLPGYRSWRRFSGSRLFHDSASANSAARRDAALLFVRASTSRMLDATVFGRVAKRSLRGAVRLATGGVP